MEDRFNVVNDLERTETSIYGIFDGHGGEVMHDELVQGIIHFKHWTSSDYFKLFETHPIFCRT